MALAHAVLEPHDIHGAARWVLAGGELGGYGTCDAPDVRVLAVALGFSLAPWVPEEREGDCGLYDLEGMRLHYRPSADEREDCAAIAHELGHYGYEGACDVGLIHHNEHLAWQLGLAIMMPRSAFEARLREHRHDLRRLFSLYPLVPQRLVLEYATYFLG